MSSAPTCRAQFDLLLERLLVKDGTGASAPGQRWPCRLGAWAGSAPASLAEVAPSPASDGPEAFVGREPELKRLGEVLQRAGGGSGRVVFLTGEPGIGKTALGDAFLRLARRRNRSLLAARGRCVEQYGQGEAYLPWLDALGGLLEGPHRERILGVLRTHAPTWCLHLPASFDSSGIHEQLLRETIGATKERMLRELGDVLGVLAAGTPMVLLLEDLHWADPSSIDLLRHLGQRIGRQRLLVVGTYRAGDVELGNHPLKSCRLELQAHGLCEGLALGTLSQEDLAGYLDARFDPNDFPQEFSALLLRRTEGHPLFATGLVQFLVERGDIAHDGNRWRLIRPLAEITLEAPESVRGMIARKIAALTEEDRKAIQYATIEGEEFTSAVLAGLLGVDDLALEERLDRLDRVHRLIDSLGEVELPDGTLTVHYRFAHCALPGRALRRAGQQASGVTPPPGWRVVGPALRRSSPADRRAARHPFRAGRDLGRAVEYFIRAGDNATTIYANSEAAEHFSHALGLLAKLPNTDREEREATIMQKRGAANMALSRFDRAVLDFDRVLELARTLGIPSGSRRP